MLSAGAERCAIVNMASIHGMVAALGNGAYTAAKHGVVGITRNTAAEYGLQDCYRSVRLKPLAATTLVICDSPDMTRIVRRPQSSEGIDGILYSFELVPDTQVLALLEDFGVVATRLGLVISGKPGEPGKQLTADNRLAGVWVPTFDNAGFFNELVLMDHRVDDV